MSGQRWAAAAVAMIWASAAGAQTPWFDAGNQAMIMHQGDLLEQQTAPNGGASAGKAGKKPVRTADCSISASRERLRPEYHRRVQAQGRKAADAWLQQQAAALGRHAAQMAKAGTPCRP
ncbi:hypothetical protein [Paracoccus sp. MKU1]|uniref:hypothetical protein n=1 Tax=Paracoccus sp. MKU1 TaxID=1745182 RepID=UPI0007190759|nr:hypothetical protein [Paracoccus sp. MKU1]